ncbi:TetR/AcrR family transcriptional regulator [Catenulispora yoronensis]
MPTYRSTYHHGNLRVALTEAALDLARRGGPHAVTVRGAARQVGVTPTAAYRHFAEVDELRSAAKDRALMSLSEAIDGALRQVGADADPGANADPVSGADPVTAAVARVRAVADGYIAFARGRPGLFAMACHGTVEAVKALMTARVAPSMEDLSASHPGLDFALWSSVHCLAVLGIGQDQPDASADAVLDAVLAWIAGS